MKFVASVCAAAGVTTVLLFGGIFGNSSTSDQLVLGAARPANAALQEPLARLLEGLSTGDTAGLVSELEQRVEENPYDADAFTLLGLSYQQRARETGDPSYYELSEQALQQGLPSGPHEALVTTGLATLAVARHRFDDALVLAQKAIELDSANASAYGALGDALLSLGRYDEAFAAYDQMAELAPSVASYARIANSREILGRPAAAIDAMALSLEVGTRVPEYEAWVHVQLGNLNFRRGHLRKAEAAYRRALERLPAYVHAEGGLARIDAADGDYEQASERLERVLKALPLPEYAILAGDVLRSAGREPEAAEAYAFVGVLQRLLKEAGVRTELQTALFDLDHDQNLADALARARAAHRLAPGIDSEDTLAWALYKNGRCGEALRYSKRSLRLGTKDALKLFHRGMIERCVGNEPDGRQFLERALAINPYFSLLYVPVAREALT